MDWSPKRPWAVAARESFIRDEADPAGFAERLYTVLSAALLGTPPPTGDPQRYTYANYRFRDVLSVVHQARRTMPDGPLTYPDHGAQWASRGLRLTGTSAADHRHQIRALPGYAPDKAHARIGDVTRSGLCGAITSATEEHVRRAFRAACAEGPQLAALLQETAVRVAQECALTGVN
ncbi:hypothetical protein ACIOEZ_16540 [Streptomyces sp. NPDC087866]|uniref:hypothetical protein n=1 Tax=unclassified Streptomyces TaxID=2593676 RepID=UPI0033B65E61